MEIITGGNLAFDIAKRLSAMRPGIGVEVCFADNMGTKWYEGLMSMISLYVNKDVSYKEEGNKLIVFID